MDDNRIKQIVQSAFEKAKNKSASHRKYALARQISSDINLSSKTIERAYDKYVNNKEYINPLQAESIDEFCRYLEYENYAEYVNLNLESELTNPEETQQIPQEVSNGYKKWIVLMVVGVVFLFGLLFTIRGLKTGSDSEYNCMTWADSLYVISSCDEGPYTKYGTKVETLDRMKLKNFKKVNVTQAYPFFSEDDKPLIWYSKNKEGIEYFTSPGLHPITGETLRKITPHIIQNYIPLHVDKKESFIQ
ncbi:hypothetical protein JQC67_02655 [Aurantibacter crassamenti]|uniref:hypothetical protein n=1 Tax=Aurantibacter crassamenti TaxID=1837375 RepID=UPI001939D1F9|nr:hypothetical protein [Aurantibacter crassamenti]MBM1105031.1 hypothetical protein [Aurantibacter crassamenti]